MPNVDDVIYLDGTQVQVSDTYSITEPGEDGDTWSVHELQDERGALSLYVEEDNEHALYCAIDPSLPAPEGIDWDYRAEIKLTSAVHGKRGKLAYATGTAVDGRDVLLIDTQMWQLEDYLISYGPEDAWIARATTPAAQLAPFELTERCEAPNEINVIGWIIVGLIALWGVASILIGPSLGFGWGLWILGVAGVVTSTFGHPRRPRLAFSAGFGLYTLSAFALVPLVSAALPQGGADALLAVVFWVAMTVLALVWHRGLYIIGDSAIKGSCIALALYTLGLLAVCLFDEDFSWLENWWWYFRDTPYRYFWPPIFVAFLVYYYYDYRDVPLSERGFMQLRAKVTRHLSSAQPFDCAKRIGDGADDLADALHLSSEPRVRALGPYRDLLQEIARVFRSGDLGAFPHSGPLAEQAKADLRLLAEELSQMDTSGKAFRISPLLRFATGENPERGDYLEMLAARAQGVESRVPEAMASEALHG